MGPAQEAEIKAKAKDVVKKYVPGKPIQGLRVDDVEYPDLEAILTTFQAFAGENVHMRNLMRATAAALNINLPQWDPGKHWGKTIDEKWRRL